MLSEEDRKANSEESISKKVWKYLNIESHGLGTSDIST